MHRGCTSILFMLLMLGRFLSQAQITFDRWAISSFFLIGNTGDEAIEVCGGQPAYNLIQSSDLMLSQGFLQPNKGELISCDIDVQYDPCSKLYSVSIDSISQCSSNDSLVIIWNDEEGSRSYATTDSIVRLSLAAGRLCSYLKYLNLRVLANNNELCELIFYNFITPNQDGSNDGWVIENIDQEKFRNNTVTISNRWGQRVWQTENYDNVNRIFSGKDQEGNPLPDGTYYYVAVINNTTHKGFIEITR